MTPRELVYSLIREAALEHECPAAEIAAKGGRRHVCVARRWVYRRLREHRWSIRRIGRAFNRDHKAVQRSLAKAG